MKIMQIRFNVTAVFFRTNEEKSLKKEFGEMILDLKTIYQSFASYIFEQNDYFERKKRILTMKTRVMQIQINLSKYL